SFVTYYNQQKGTSYTFPQLDSMYRACGITLNENKPIIDSFPAKTLCGYSTPVIPPVDLSTVSLCSDSSFFIHSAATELYKVYKDSLIGDFESAYLDKCMQAYKLENFTVTHAVSEFHYTLYYYDQAGNLVKTVPPKGVVPNRDALWLADVKAKRAARQAKVPAHTMATHYRYNTLNQVVAQQTPDAGQSRFWYDRLGRLALSQDARQRAVSSTAANRLYSYTLYDQLGRIIEVGQIKDNSGSVAISDTLTRNPSVVQSWLTARTNYRGQITKTQYDEPYDGYSGFDSRLIVQQRNLRNRVSYTSYTDTAGSSAFNNATLYSYDIHGNVDTLLQDYGSQSFVGNVMNKNNNRFKKISYQYDLISGKVNQVAYQRGWSDQLFHRYAYDAENRLVLAESSFDSLRWEKEAQYAYYHHGPLARMELGQQQVQGVDYAYTIHGWLKGLNSTSLITQHDMGQDGYSGAPHQYTARDVIGLSLNYYDTADFSPINNSYVPFYGVMGFIPDTAYRPLFNGNISSMAVHNRRLRVGEFTGSPLMFYNYRYDQLNRLTSMESSKKNNLTFNTWAGLSLQQYLLERISYDDNGNILNYVRYGHKPLLGMDLMTYYYESNSNRLNYIWDPIPTNRYGLDPGDIPDIDAQNPNNYLYDASGNLVRDVKQDIASIKWSVYGKILEITRWPTTNAPIQKIRFSYDAQGNRIGKIVELNSGAKSYIWYVRDAQGNMMATYEASGSSSNLSDLDLSLTERPLYGSSRLGIYQQDVNVDGGPADMSDSLAVKYYRGYRHYELSNHLGNVLATITDKKKGVDENSNGIVDYYDADVTSAQDYYPFGMIMPGRNWSSSTYRFGFNGKENDNEIKGLGNQQDYGMRIYDPRIGRFLSVDPITKEYPELTPYQFASNKPINSIDIDGLEGWELNSPANNLKRMEAQYKVVLNPLQNTPRPKPSPEISSITKPEIQRSVEYTNQVNRMNALYNSDQGWSFRIFSGIGQAAVSFGEGEAIGYAAGKVGQGVKYLSNALRSSNNFFGKGTTVLNRINTPFEPAEQALTKEAFDALDQVNKGAPLYRIGTLGKSHAAEGQFWSLENPANYLNNPEVFAAKYGMPAENLKSGEVFVEMGRIKSGANFITRPAPGVGTNDGGAIEVVTNPGGVKLEAFNIINN
ncbi:MAG: hypothetical protein JNL51_18430, partial [Chitinophagaceae bacterium]|nr:hypothetical protein [Chitinophagaceae bacterium]